MYDVILKVCVCSGAIAVTVLVLAFCLTGVVGLIKLLAKLADLDIDTPQEEGWRESWSGKKK